MKTWKSCSQLRKIVKSVGSLVLGKGDRENSVGLGCTHVMHGRSRMTIDCRIPTIPGRSMSGFHRPGRHCLHQERGVVRCWATRMKDGLHPTKNRFRGGLACG